MPSPPCTPPLGCTVQAAAGGKTFVCPCHSSTFDAEGRRINSSPAHTNHAPREMDVLGCRVGRDDETRKAWVKVSWEQFVPGLSRKVVRG